MPSCASLSSYSLISPSPVAYAQELSSSTDMKGPPSYPMVTLKVYWSEERKDFQTTTMSLYELNDHGGNYTWCEDIGYIASNITPEMTSVDYVPLTVSYDVGRMDAATAPLSYEDLNVLFPDYALETGNDIMTYRQGPMIGYATRAECEFCNVSMSETFPSDGGADCAYACSEGKSCKGTKFVLGGLLTLDAPLLAFDGKMREAGLILEQYGDATVTTGSGLHISVNYFCCYTDTEFDVIQGVLDNIQWESLKLDFDRPAWRIDSDSVDVDHYSIIVLLDEESQAVMNRVVENVEAKVRAVGLDIHIPRSDQEPFHSTLGVVNGSTYPCVAAMNAVNEAIPPGKWTPLGPITVKNPTYDW